MEIAVASGAVLRATFIVYALPILGLLALAVAAQLLAQGVAPALAEPAAAAGGVLGVVLGAFAARRLARHPGAGGPPVRVVRLIP